MAAQVGPEQRQVADHVQHLVPGRLVGEAQLVLDGAARPEDQQVGRRQVRPDALPAQQIHLVVEDEGPAGGKLAGERARREFQRVDLLDQRRHRAVIEEVGEL